MWRKVIKIVVCIAKRTLCILYILSFPFLSLCTVSVSPLLQATGRHGQEESKWGVEREGEGGGHAAWHGHCSEWAAAATAPPHSTPADKGKSEQRKATLPQNHIFLLHFWNEKCLTSFEIICSSLHVPLTPTETGTLKLHEEHGVHADVVSQIPFFSVLAG